MEIILDFDGTLVDGASYSFSALLNLARDHGYRRSARAARAALAGCTDYEVADRLSIDQAPTEFTRRLLETNRRCLEQARWHPELHGVLRELAGRHALFVLSNRDHESLGKGLSRLEIHDLVRTWIGSTPGVPGKPSTGLYRRLRTQSPERRSPGIYVGDKHADREFARRAGLGFVAACWYRRALDGDHTACRSLEELPTILDGLLAPDTRSRGAVQPPEQ